MTTPQPDSAAPFARTLRQLRGDRGQSLRKLAEQSRVGKSYISELEHGTKPPTLAVARALDDALHAGGSLSALIGAAPMADREPPRPRAGGQEPIGDRDIEQLHDTVRHLVALDTMHGSDGLASNAARAFRNTQRRLATTGVREEVHSDLLAALAELGEVAAWLAFDNEQQDASRQLAAEATLLAQRIGDISMLRFLASHMSMQAVYLERPAEALDLAGRVLADDPRSPRVVGMMRVRRARALGLLGGTDDALREMERARVQLENGVGPTDPQWTWWWHTAELARHESHIKLAAGDAEGAVAASERAVALVPDGQGRDRALFRAGLLSNLIDVRAWHEADQAADPAA
jgi:transcriptional regulator with XRE-family HTH domain